ncbi:putative bifunctional diguanylate cyclase/phosphodiesterase [Pusillimonas sp.]|uniref:putative bifunctional diguanylate cyclase/phosphodiesterase n=1 Tax=Pusillimonas sp. TaxID=3040095 RepID=UPI0029B743A1|nr:EAL domain-containing protein [Pusillimonas sp.]MDX3893826.1 EAL domain-containing protein [Pusillimonas sp.]
MLDSSYNAILVVFSFLVAILASYTALSMASQISKTRGRAAAWWLGGGAFAMGLGIWSMHFIGMLAFSLPIELGYDPWLTLLSLLVAIASSAFALWVACRRRLTAHRLCMGALVMGLGVAGMHYLGMEAMMMLPRIVYDAGWFALSLFIAVTASGAALWITAYLSRHGSHRTTLKIAAAIVMGCAIVGMHYSGMAAARFPLGSLCRAANAGVDTDWLSVLVTMVTIAVLAIALVITVLDSRHASRTGALNLSLHKANKALEHMALHDVLTHLPNRALLEDRIEQARQTALRNNTRFTILFMDLDGFKTVNDAYGHAVGDELLVETARRIRSGIRGEDTVARFGGDEFVVLSQTDGAEDIATLAAKIVDLVARPYNIRGFELRLSTSIGIAIYPEDGLDADALLINADAAMYYRKDMGRNGYSFFDPSMNANAEEHLQLVQDLRQAVERGELLLHYQPRFDDPDGPAQGAEALVRWQHPRHGLIMPDDFIPTAEKTGLIIDIDNWVLNEACRQIKEWRDQGHEWTVSVNLSPLQFAHADLIQTVGSALRRHGLPPGCLVLEITESTAMRNVDASMTILRQLDELGVKISIDDFGTGYSSLLYLKRLPASELKIDRGFISELVRDTEDAAIVSAIIALGKALQLKIVAEGVETPAQQEFLSELGCDSLQGYLLGHPVPGTEFSGLHA